MPSPIGHTLVGLSVGLAGLLQKGRWSSIRVTLADNKVAILIVLIAANFPDLDYLPGILAGELNKYHHYYTHTIGWVLVSSLGIWFVWKAFEPGLSWRMLVLVAAVMSSHLVADILTVDTRAPHGIMALWPLTDARIISPVPLFMNMSKSELQDVFTVRNLLPAFIEVLWGAVCLFVVLGRKSQKTRA